MKYLVPYDFSAVTKNAVNNCIHFCQKFGGEIVLVHVVDDQDEIYKKELQLNQDIHSFSSDVKMKGVVVVGKVLDDIGKIADAQEVDYVFMGTHGVDFSQKIFGSHAVKMIANATVPFVILQDHVNMKEVKNIVLPYSIENKSLQVLKIASKICKSFGAKLHLIGRHHSDEFLLHQENASIILAKRHLLDEKVEHHFELVEVSKGDFPDKIVEYAKEVNADMISTTFYSDSIMPMFETFVRDLIVNKHHIPVLCVNAKSLAKADSILSFMTN